MKEIVGKILENRQLAEGIYLMKIETTESEFTRPGQFAMIKVPGKFLRRPISVACYGDDSFTIVYKVVGEGTRAMSLMAPDEQIEVLTGLGNGYDTEVIPEGSLVIGGGIGTPPMLGLVRELASKGRSCSVILGFNTADEVFMEDDFRAVADDVTVVTVDGSYGEKGFVTDAFDKAEYVLACGPLAMLKALSPKCGAGQFSLEARMGCGFGACMGCSIRTLQGPMRVCKEGPVFDKEVLVWDQL